GDETRAALGIPTDQLLEYYRIHGPDQMARIYSNARPGDAATAPAMPDVSRGFDPNGGLLAEYQNGTRTAVIEGLYRAGRAHEEIAASLDAVEEREAAQGAFDEQVDQGGSPDPELVRAAVTKARSTVEPISGRYDELRVE